MVLQMIFTSRVYGKGNVFVVYACYRQAGGGPSTKSHSILFMFSCLFRQYFGVNVEPIEDPVRRNALKTMIKTYGQTPKHLFKNPHQVKQVRQKKPSVDGD